MELAPAPPAPATATGPRCLQCGTRRVGAYCHECGQHASVADRLTFRSLWQDFRTRRLNLDRGLFRTLVDVVRRPGAVALAFVEGRRQTYTHPITMLFVVYAVYAVYAVIYGLLEDGMREMTRLQIESQLGSLPSDGPGIAMLEPFMAETTRILYSYGSYFSLLIILPFAAMLRWLLADRGRTVAECAVLGAYVEVAVVVPSALLVTPLGVKLQSPALLSASLALYLVYAAWGARHFFDRRASTMALAALSITVALAVYLALLLFVAVGFGVYAGYTEAHGAG